MGTTEIEGGYYLGEKIKKVDEDIYFVENGRYTTCDRPDPHYYFGSPKMKIIRGDKVVAEPVYLFIDDVPIFALPLDIFPNHSGRSSGLIPPAYGEDATYGRYFSHLGYFWAVNDYTDLTFLGDYFTKVGSLRDLKDLLNYELPLIGVIALAGAAAVAIVRRPPPPVLAGALVIGLGAAVYLRSRADEQHAQPLLIAACALVPVALATRPPRVLAGVLVAALALIAAGGAANRVSALVRPPDLEPVHLDGVPGIRVPPAEAEALPQLVRTVQELVPPGEPIYVAPRRSDLVTLSDPLVHFLVRRPNVLRDDVLLQAQPDEQERIVAALERARPRVVVRWTDPASDRPEDSPRGRPSGSRALDEYLASAYRLHARFGFYDVLVPRD